MLHPAHRHAEVALRLRLHAVALPQCSGCSRRTAQREGSADLERGALDLDGIAQAAAVRIVTIRDRAVAPGRLGQQRHAGLRLYGQALQFVARESARRSGIQQGRPWVVHSVRTTCGHGSRQRARCLTRRWQGSSASWASVLSAGKALARLPLPPHGFTSWKLRYSRRGDGPLRNSASSSLTTGMDAPRPGRERQRCRGGRALAVAQAITEQLACWLLGLLLAMKREGIVGARCCTPDLGSP